MDPKLISKVMREMDRKGGKKGGKKGAKMRAKRSLLSNGAGLLEAQQRPDGTKQEKSTDRWPYLKCSKSPFNSAFA
jgi:hypothetical protein